MGRVQSGALGHRSCEGGVSNPIPESSSSIAVSSRISSLLGEPGKIFGSRDRGEGDAPEGSNRAGGGQQPGVLQSPLLGSEGVGCLASSSRCFQPKQVCQKDQILHGDHSVGSVCHPSGRLDDFHGHEGRVLSYPNSSGFQALPEVFVQRPQLSVQSSLLRPEYGSSSFYEGFSTSCQDLSSSWHKDNIVSRRLAGSGQISGGDETRKEIYHGSSPRIRDHYQLREVRFGTSSSGKLFRDEDRFEDFLGFPRGETGGYCSKNNLRISFLKLAACEALDEAARAHVLSGEVHSRGQTEDETFSICPSKALEQSIAIGQDPNSSLARSSSRTVLVGQQRQVDGRYFSSSEEPRPSVVFRRVSSRLGSHSCGSTTVRQLVPNGKPTTHKQLGIEGHLVCSEGDRASCLSKGSVSVFGQHYGSGLPSKTRRYQIPRSVSPCEGNSVVDRGEGDLSSSAIHLWNQECDCGHSKQERTGHTHGVDLEHGGLSATVEALGTAQCGLVCHQDDSKASHLHVSSSGRGGSGNRRHVAVLVQHGRLCLPSVRPHQRCDQQIQTFFQLQDDSGRAMVASKGMVSGLGGTAGGYSQDASTQTGSLNPASGEAPPSKPPHSTVNRLETVVRFGRAKKLSNKVSSKINSARRPSTNSLYQHRWSVYFQWCRSHNYSASRPTVNSICEFLIYLKEEKKLATDTIRGYRSMLHTVLRHVGFDIRNNEDIGDVIRALQIQDPPGSKEIVYWNLDVVLRFLCSSKFEPLEQASLVDLTKKTLFLITLALAKRVSEIQALSRLVGFSVEGAVVSLIMGFRAKNDYKCKALPRSFLIKSLIDLVGNEEEAKLCPVRALKIYLLRTRELRGPHNCRLFVAPRDPTRPASKNAISYFIRRLIKEAHEFLNPDMLPILRAKPHEVRAVATSIAFQQNLSLTHSDLCHFSSNLKIVSN